MAEDHRLPLPPVLVEDLCAIGRGDRAHAVPPHLVWGSDATASLRRLQTVSSDNVDILRRGLEAFNRDGVEGLIEILDPEFEGHTDPELTIEPGVYVGHAGIRRWFAGFEGFIDDVRFEPDEFIPAGDRVLV